MSKHFPHGIDITAPGGISELMDFHRATFGDAVMEADGGQEQQEPGGSEPEKADEKLGEPGIKALQAERDARSRAEKDLADARAALQKIEDEKLSDIDRARKEVADSNARLEALGLENARLAALANHPVPKDYQDLVTGHDAESFAASAKKVAALAAAAEGRGKLPDPVRESGSRSTTETTSTGGSISAGRAMFADKNKKKEA